MKIVVCVKQVPDTTEVKINPETNTLIREGVPSILNPFDLHAVEAGLKLREQHGGTVTVVTMGPPQAAEILKETIALGADEVVLVSDRAFGGSDTLATAYTLARTIAKLGAPDLILCGRQAIDGDTAQVGPGIAEQLNLPHVTCVRKIELTGPLEYRVERMTEEGYETLAVSGPMLVTVVREINTPRVPSLKGMMRAKKAVIKPWTAADIGAEADFIGRQGSPTWVVRIFTPPAPTSKAEIFQGSAAEGAAHLLSILAERKIV